MMTVQQKFQAIQALDRDVSLRLSDEGRWYVSGHIDQSDGRVRGGGPVWCDTPEKAIHEWWAHNAENLAAEKHLVVYRGPNRPELRVRWNGYMWEEATARVMP